MNYLESLEKFSEFEYCIIPAPKPEPATKTPVYIPPPPPLPKPVEPMSIRQESKPLVKKSGFDYMTKLEKDIFMAVHKNEITPELRAWAQYIKNKVIHMAAEDGLTLIDPKKINI